MSGPDPAPGVGLHGVRRSGSVTELQFLYTCATTEPTQLRPIADELGLTVQAVSHVYRGLRQRGLVEIREGRYRPTIQGVAWLHAGLTGIAEDVRDRLAHLNVVRSTRAIAASRIAPGSPVSLELVNGLLSARPGGSSPSHGIARAGAAQGGLVEVENLEGIVPIESARISVRTIRDEDIQDPRIVAQIRSSIPGPAALVAADGLEAFTLVQRAWSGSVVRFGVAAASVDAARVGVPVVVFVLQRDLPRLLARWADARAPSVDVRPLGGGRSTPAVASARPSPRPRRKRLSHPKLPVPAEGA